MGRGGEFRVKTILKIKQNWWWSLVFLKCIPLIEPHSIVLLQSCSIPAITSPLRWLSAFSYRISISWIQITFIVNIQMHFLCFIVFDVPYQSCVAMKKRNKYFLIIVILKGLCTLWFISKLSMLYYIIIILYCVSLYLVTINNIIN